MKKEARDGRKNYQIIELARAIIARVPAKNWYKEVEAIQNWVRSNIRYTRDPVNLELIQSPEKTIEIRQGDCDDHAILTAALLMAVGAPARFVAIAQNPRYYCHVYTETKIGGKWYPVETTENVNLDWQPVNITRKMIVHIN